MNRLGVLKKYILEINLSKNEVIQMIKNNEGFHLGFEQSVTKNITVLFLLKEFIKVLVNGVISISVVIEEKGSNTSVLTLVMHNPIASEGLINDLNAGKSTRKAFFKDLEPYIIHIKEIID